RHRLGRDRRGADEPRKLRPLLARRDGARARARHARRAHRPGSRGGLRELPPRVRRLLRRERSERGPRARARSVREATRRAALPRAGRPLRDRARGRKRRGGGLRPRDRARPPRRRAHRELPSLARPRARLGGPARGGDRRLPALARLPRGSAGARGRQEEPAPTLHRTRGAQGPRRRRDGRRGRALSITLRIEHWSNRMKIPARGMSRDEVMAALAKAREADTDFRNGRVFGFAYDAGPEAERVSKEAYASFLSENALDPRVYPSLRRFELDVVGMCKEHLRAGPEVVGTFTSGGTESILLAVKAARDYA